jgi:DNA polymerase-3 subunit alpha
MSMLEKLGLLKMDFLGLTTLTIVFEALRLIKKTRGEDIVLDQLPLDDKETYEHIFQQGLTDGVFQFESSGMKDVLRRSKPERVEDLIALNALYRPGPIQNGFVDDYIDRKLGRKPVTYDLPELKSLLEETYGLVLYQEQVMQVAQRIAGYSLGEADLLRRAMGKKKKEEMDKQRVRFLRGAAEKGHPTKRVEALFDLLAKFAEYGFNKSHSAAYGYLAYLTGYLKEHYAVEFMAALLTSETGNTDKVVKYINECRLRGIDVLPPDVNQSDLDFTPVSRDKIRFGMGAVKNAGAGAVEAIVAARDEGGPFRTLDDICERVDMGAVNRRVLESLIKAGAMDGLAGTRAQLFAVIEDCMESGARARKDRLSGQVGLFGELLAGGPDGAAHDRALPNVNDWTAAEKLGGEKEILGFYVSGHPLDAYRWKVTELTHLSTETLGNLKRGEELAICGIITGIERRKNKEQKPWAFFQLEDWHGCCEACVFASRYELLQHELKEDVAVMLRAKAMPDDDGSVKLNVQEIIPLDVARVDFPSLISIRVRLGANGADKAAALKQLIDSKPGQTAVRLKLDRARDFVLLLDVRERVRPDKDFKARIAELFGSEAYEVLG